MLLVDPGWGDKKLDLLIKFIFVHRVEREWRVCRDFIQYIVNHTTFMIVSLRIIDVQSNEL